MSQLNAIVPVSYSDAKSFVETWHYSHKMPTGKNICFGWLGDDGGLYAVGVWGIGVNGYQADYLARLTGLPVTSDTLLELKRLCRIEPKASERQLTQFIAECHRRLKGMGYRYVVSFSDPEQNHCGGVYRAGNFFHLGQTNAEYHVVGSDGVVRHRRYPFRYARRHNVSIAEARERLGLVKIKTQPKDRWFIPLGRVSKSIRASIGETQ